MGPVEQSTVLVISSESIHVHVGEGEVDKTLQVSFRWVVVLVDLAADETRCEGNQAGLEW